MPHPNLGDDRREFLDDVLNGLRAPQKSIPGKYLWDEQGSKIFEAISQSPDYYQTEAEMALTAEALPDIASALGPGACIVEFGSGASHKIRLLLDALDTPRRYVALDISHDFLQAAAARIAADYPRLSVEAVCADYSRPLPQLPVDRSGKVFGFFPGTSIGNMEPGSAARLLTELRRALAPGFLLIGQDPNHDAAMLQAAYEGRLMTALHKNVLARLQRELGANLNIDAYRHESRTFANRVEPHLIALEETSITIGDSVATLSPGESIRTDLSWKYDPEDFSALAMSAGWSVVRHWLDRQRRFCLYLLSTA